MLLTQALDRTASARGDLPALNYKRDGAWCTISWREYRERIHRAARALIALGVAAGEHVTILGFNCPEWFIADVGAIVAGAIPAGIYTTNSPEQCQYVAEHCSARVAFVENHEQLAKFLTVRASLPALRAIVLMHGTTDAEGVLSWDEFLARGSEAGETELAARLAAQREDDVCTLIYTSGTTGAPKGVMLSHANLTWIMAAASSHIDVQPGDVMLSYLPLSHVAEQCFSLIGNIVFGSWVWFAESIDTVPETLRDARPHHFLAVPRVWEKMQARMEAVGATNSGLKRRIAKWARGVGAASNYALQNGASRGRGYGIAQRLVFSKVRKALGLDRARTLITGAAPIARTTLDFFLSLDMPILEVYGMSECTAITTISTPRRYRTGKAGWILPGTEVRLAEDGEICIRGPHVFKGYFRDAEASAAAIDSEGWLHSGDIGEIDAEGYVQITDRKKELIITAGGENIAPALVEGHLKTIPGVSQAVVVGDRRRYLAVLLALDPEKIPTLASLAGSPARTLQEASECERFSAHLQQGIDAVNQRLARVQTVKRFAILPAELSIDGGELTPTMKVKRKVVHEKYAALIDRLYHDG